MGYDIVKSIFDEKLATAKREPIEFSQRVAFSKFQNACGKKKCKSTIYLKIIY